MITTITRWLLVSLAIVSVSNAEITREEMHPSIYEYKKPLVCKFVTEQEDGTRVFGETFILTWAQLESLDKYTMTFKKDGKIYKVPAKSGYVCTGLAGG